MDGVEAWEKQRTITIPVGRPQNMQKSRGFTACRREKREKVIDASLKWRNQGAGSDCWGSQKFVATASARVVQVIQWANKSRYRSHREGVFLVRIKYPGY